MIEESVSVDYAAIEKSLADLWRNENATTEHAVTRAALWNVVAHTSSQEDQNRARDILGRVAASIPQRSIIIRGVESEPAEIAAWISANCHLVGGEKQVCSEEVSIVAGGAAMHRVAPLVSALLLPDMPVAVWWVGNVPHDHEYIETLLNPADRVIVDSSHFDSLADLVIIGKVARKSATAPADLTWVRLEEWRTATASLFDSPSARERLRTIRRVTIVISGGVHSFGDSTKSILYSAWLTAQSGANIEHVDVRNEPGPRSSGSIMRVEIEFGDGTIATVHRDPQHQVLVSAFEGRLHTTDCLTRLRERDIESLIVRQLKRVGEDRVYARTLPIALKLAEAAA